MENQLRKRPQIVLTNVDILADFKAQVKDRCSVGFDYFQAILGTVRFSVGGNFVVVAVDEVQASVPFLQAIILAAVF